MDKIPAKTFWNKLDTKKWLAENTTFKYPETVVEPFGLKELPETLEALPSGSWALKPTEGKQSIGIVLFDKNAEGLFKILSSDLWTPINNVFGPITLAVKKKIVAKKARGRKRKWFVEPWIKPHEKLHIFTTVPVCPPILRFYCRPEVNFLGVCPVIPEFTGLSYAGWESRHYVWLDLTGTVQNHRDIDLTGIDSKSIKIFKDKSLEEAPYGYRVEGIPEIIRQINEEIAPRVTLFKERSWGLEGTFDVNNNFVCIELNHSPGSQFQNYNWSNQNDFQNMPTSFS